MEIDAIWRTKRGTILPAKVLAERLEYQRQGKCWGCEQVGHVHSNCLTNPSKPLALSALEKGAGTREQEKGKA